MTAVAHFVWYRMANKTPCSNMTRIGKTTITLRINATMKRNDSGCSSAKEQTDDIKFSGRRMPATVKGKHLSP
jgi:hypothetical protein